MTPKNVELLLGDSLITHCPHCKTRQGVDKWGLNTCKFEECGKQYFAELYPDKILEELLAKKKRETEPANMWANHPTKLQKLADGSHILVHQSGGWTAVGMVST